MGGSATMGRGVVQCPAMVHSVRWPTSDVEVTHRHADLLMAERDADRGAFEDRRTLRCASRGGARRVPRRRMHGVSVGTHRRPVGGAVDIEHGFTVGLEWTFGKVRSLTIYAYHFTEVEPGDHVGPQEGVARMHHVLDRRLGERRALHVRKGHGVHCDVDSAGVSRDPLLRFVSRSAVQVSAPTPWCTENRPPGS